MTASSIDLPPAPLLTVDIAAMPSATRVIAVGEIDASTASVLRERLDDVLGGDVRNIVVDLVAVTFLDSAGLCVLAGSHRRAADLGVTMSVLASARAVVRPMQITGLWELLDAELVTVDAAPAS